MPNGTEVDTNMQLKLEEIRQQGETARLNARYAFYGSIFTGIITVLTGTLIPLLLRSYHAETIQKVEAGKVEVAVAADAARTEAEAARTEAKNAVLNTKKLDEKADANLKLWKAYHTKDTDDMNVAQAALAKAEVLPSAETKTAEAKQP